MSGPPGLSTSATTVFLIDGNNFLFRAFHALPMLTAPDGTPTNAVHGFVRMIHALRRDCSPGYFAAIFDAGGGNFRHELFPEYKANRGDPPDELIPQFGLVREALDAMAVPRVEARGAEADDIIATYARQARAAGQNVVVVSSDKDLMQLVTDESPTVQLLDTMKNAVIGPEKVEKRFGVAPGLLGDLLALAGDSSDNIPGVPGIGPKTAAALLAEYGDLEAILAAAPEIKQKKRRERLIEHAGDARMSRKLVTLKEDVEVPPLETLRDKGMSHDAAVTFFSRYGFTAMLRELGADVVSVPRPAALTDFRTDEAAIELRPASAPFVPAGDDYQTLWAADADALAKTLGELGACEQVAVQVLTTHADPMRASMVGISLCGVGADGVRTAPTYIPFGHADLGLGAGVQLQETRALELLRPFLEDETIAKSADGFKAQAIVLDRHGVSLAGVAFDTMLASYVLDPARGRHGLQDLARDLLGAALMTEEKLRGKGKKALTMPEVAIESAATYAASHVEACAALTHELGQQVDGGGESIKNLLHKIEIPLAQVLRALEPRGILLDTDELHRQGEVLGKSIAKIRATVAEEAGYEVNIDSPLQLQKFLFEERGLPPGRKTKTGYSTDARVLEELSVLDPIVAQILEYRSLTKLKGTYLDTLPNMVNPETGRLHTVFRQAVAQTGRLSSIDPNLQNIPVRTEHGRRIREAFVAPEGRVLVALDYSQIELRILAHMSGDPNLTSAFRDDVDVHRRTAAEVFEIDERDVTSEHRGIAKAVNFGVIYGQTAFGLAQQLGIPRGKAGIYIKKYFEKVPGVDAFMKTLIEISKRKGYAETLLGRKRRIPELRARGPARAHGERMARNTPIQGSAADVLKLAMIDVEKQVAPLAWADMLLTVHDELIFECAQDKVDDLVAIARPAMENAFRLDVPLKVDVGQGKTWAACKG